MMKSISLFVVFLAAMADPLQSQTLADKFIREYERVNGPLTASIEMRVTDTQCVITKWPAALGAQPTQAQVDALVTAYNTRNTNFENAQATRLQRVRTVLANPIIGYSTNSLTSIAALAAERPAINAALADVIQNIRTNTAIVTANKLDRLLQIQEFRANLEELIEREQRRQ